MERAARFIANNRARGVKVEPIVASCVFCEHMTHTKPPLHPCRVAFKRDNAMMIVVGTTVCAALLDLYRKARVQ